MTAVFVRSRGGKWALLGLEEAPSGTGPFGCDKPPYHDAKDARLALKPLAVDWVVEDGVHQLDLSPLGLHSCAIDTIELHLGEGRTSQSVDLGCWIEDGFSFDKEDSMVALSSPVPNRASLRVVFTDGSALSWSLLNPDASDDESSENESLVQEADPEPEPALKVPAPAVSWAQAVQAIQPCWELGAGEVYARVYGPADEGLEAATRALAVADCKVGRDRVGSFLAGHSKLLAEIDTKIQTYENAVELHRAYAALEFPRAEDREAFKASVEALQKEFPSLVDQRESTKEALGEVLGEARFSECRGPVEQLMKETGGIERAFSAGLPVKNLKAREDARAEMVQAHADLRDHCSVDAEGMVRAAAALVDDAGLVLDHHDQLRPVGNGNWRAPTARISDAETRLQGTTLDVFREVALFVASQAPAAPELKEHDGHDATKRSR